MFGITGNWSTAALDPRVWCSTLCKEGCRFMVAWVRGGEKASENRQRNKKADKVPPGVTVGSLRHFRIALIGLAQGFKKRRRLRR